MVFKFEKATRTKSKARIALTGPSGSGKTYTALTAAKALANGGKVAVIDTERGSASLYSDKFDFDVLEMDNFNPDNYIKAINMAEDAGYSVVVIDSLSHAWEGEGGALDLHNTKTKQTGNSWTAWADVTPLHRNLIDSVLQSKCHIIATMRSKMEYVQEKDDKTGKTTIRKVGLAPVQRNGIEYEFTMMADMDWDHNLIISKTRIESFDGKTAHKPDVTWFRPLVEWLNSGKEQEKTMKETAQELGATVTKVEKKVEPVKVETPAVDIKTPMSYEMAYNETSEDGELYGEIETPKLSFMVNALMKSMKGDLTPEEREEKSRKSDAIRTLLAYRAAGNNG